MRPGLAEVTITRPGGLSVSPTVIETPDAAQAAQAARARSAEFDWDTILATYESELRALAGTGPARLPEQGRAGDGLPTRAG